MDAIIAIVADLAARSTDIERLVVASIFALVGALMSLGYDYIVLRRRNAEVEEELFERSVGRQSTNWASTAQNLERKAKDPGDVARSSAMTHLHMLDEAANAWLKGSQWPEALRVTQEFMRECAHAVTKPSIHEDDFRAAADLIERRLQNYPDLSKAANEAPENADLFLGILDTTLSVLGNVGRIGELRDHVAAAREAIDAHAGGKHKAA